MFRNAIAVPQGPMMLFFSKLGYKL